jgi:4-hydroxybenzoate polyprenyltransferase
MILLFIFLSTIYSAPPRIRDKAFFDVLANCLIFTIFYLQSYFFSNDKFNSIFFILIILLYFLFQEILHQLAHFKNDKKSGRKKTVVSLGFKNAISFLKKLPVIYSFIAFLLFLLTNELIFVVMLFFNLLRINKMREINKNSNFLYLRDNVYGIYEFTIYILLNIWLK